MNIEDSLTKAHYTATGPNEAHYEFLKRLSKILLQYLLEIYKIRIRASIHALWKNATITPIP